MVVKRFKYSDLDSKNKAFEIRRKVFVEEQKVKDYEEFDEFEESSVHYLAEQGGEAVGTARWRITKDGVKLERFAVLREFRKKGVGASLLRAVLKDIPLGLPVYLHAQLTAIGFYSRHGFEKQGKEFVECDIRHFTMGLPTDEIPGNLPLHRAIDHVRNFHEAFNLNLEHSPRADIGPKLTALRYNLMAEENDEYREAAESGDLTEVADALGDMLYILCGTIISHGLQHKIAPVFEEIQRSNMSKLDAEGNPIYREDGKVLKSDRYFKPDLERILNEK